MGYGYGPWIPYDSMDHRAYSRLLPHLEMVLRMCGLRSEYVRQRSKKIKMFEGTIQDGAPQ